MCPLLPWPWLPIMLYGGKILDGWHRQQACDETGAESHYMEFGGSPEQARDHVVAVNSDALRRQLTASQKAMVAAGFATASFGGARPGSGRPSVTEIQRLSKDFEKVQPLTLEESSPVTKQVHLPGADRTRPGPYQRWYSLMRVVTLPVAGG